MAGERPANSTGAPAARTLLRWGGWALALHVLAQGLLLHTLEAQLVAADPGGIVRFAFAVLVTHVCYRRALAAGSRRSVCEVTALCDRIHGRMALLDLDRFEALERDVPLRALLTGERDVAAARGTLAVELTEGVAVCALVGLYAISISPVGGLAITVGMLLNAAQLADHSRRARRLFGASRDERDALSTRVDQLVRGFAAIRLHGPRSRAIGEHYRGLARAVHARYRETLRAFFTMNAHGRTGFAIVLGLLTFGLPMLGARPDGDLAGLLLCLFFVGGRVGNMLILLPEKIRSDAAFERLGDLDARLAAEGVARAPGGDTHPGARVAAFEPADFSTIHLAGVCHRYPDGFASGPFDLRFARGELVLLTGSNGSGKSTLLKLLLGLYRPESGVIRLDGRVVGDGERPAYQALFSPVLANFAVFERLYGRSGVDPARVRRLLAEFDLQGAVRYVDGRFSTVRLSTGQRKRLALIVALLRDRPILVLDEWAADQDPGHRVDFYRRVLPALRAAGKTVIAVTHDDEWFHLADRRIHLVDGRVAR